MLLDVCLGTRTTWKIMLILGEAPGKAVSRKEIQSFAKIGNKALIKFLLLLEKFDVIHSNKIRNANYYKINMSNPFAERIVDIIRSEKKELNNPDIRTLNVLREFVYELTNVHIENIHHVILFGSHAKRTQTDGSDIDVAIVVDEKNPGDELLVTDIIDRLQKRFGKEIQPHYYTKKEFESEKKDKLVQEIVKDGIILL